MERSSAVLRCPERPVFRKIVVHLCRRLCAGCQLEFHFQPVNGQRGILRNKVRRRDIAERSGRSSQSQPCGDSALRSGEQIAAELVLGAVEHCRPGVDIFLDCLFIETSRHVNANLSRRFSHLLRRHNALDAAEVIGVGMADDDRLDVVVNVLAQHLFRNAQTIRRRLDVGRHINGDPAGLAPDKGQIRHINAAHLVDLSRQHLKNTCLDIRLAVEPQTGVNRIRHRLLFQKIIRLQIPDHIAGLVLQPESVQLFQAATLCQRHFAVIGIFQVDLKLPGKRRISLFGECSCLFGSCIINVFRHCSFLLLNPFQDRRFPFAPNGLFVRRIHTQCQ